MNRELTSRIRSISNLCSHHKSVVKNDIKLAMKIVQNMDKRWNLWQESSSAADSDPNKSLYDNEDDLEAPKKEATSAAESENNESANLEKSAFSALPPNGPHFLGHKVCYLLAPFFSSKRKNIFKFWSRLLKCLFANF